MTSRTQRRLDAPAEGEGHRATAEQTAAGAADALAPAALLVGRPPSLSPTLRLEVARYARECGSDDMAVAWIEGAIRHGGWSQAGLWAELVSLMRNPEDYEQVRALWLESPRKCHTSVPIMRAVARGACLGGQHGEGRDLLRRAILRRSRPAHSQPRRLASGVRKRLVLSTPGERAREASRRKQLKSSAKRALRDLQNALDEVGVRPFLVAGTLLGFVRDAGFIPWDKDIDVGVMGSHIDAQALEHALVRCEQFSVRRLDLSDHRLRVNHEADMKIDIFRHYEEGGLLWHDGAATRWWNTQFDLKAETFLGVDLLIPSDPERYLTESYGDWRRPDPHFSVQLDAPNVEITDRPYFDSLLFFSLLDAVTTGDMKRKRRFAELLEQLGEGHWLHRL